MIYRSPLKDIDIPDIPLTELVLRHCTDLSGKSALIDGSTGRAVTYGELGIAVRRLAGELVGRGFEKGDVLALMAPNTPDYAVAFHGTAMAGGIVTTINPLYLQDEVHHQLIDALATILVTAPAFLQKARAAAIGTAVTEIFVLGDDGDAEDAPLLSSMFSDPLKAHVPVAGGDLVALPYSSGTTGLSKGVQLSHRNLVANILQTIALTELSNSDTLDAVLPLFHIYGMQIMMNCGLTAGSTVVMLPKFDLQQFLIIHQTYRITRSFLAPPIVLALAKDASVDNYDLSALQVLTSAAAPLSAELGLAVSQRLGVEVVQGYGMTELSPVSHFTQPGRSKPGSVGVTAPNTETAIVDIVTGHHAHPNADGEVWVRGPQVMKGYLNNPTATASTLDEDGWLHTGDIGHIDADGHLYIVDRLKELIKYKAFQVPPAEIEAVLLTHPDIADAAVIGVFDDEVGEIPVGFVVLKSDVAASDTDIMEFVACRVAHYKQLREIRFIEAVPRSTSGKILRRQLRH